MNSLPNLKQHFDAKIYLWGGSKTTICEQSSGSMMQRWKRYRLPPSHSVQLQWTYRHLNNKGLCSSVLELEVSHLCFSLDGVHPADELTVGLEEQQQLKVQLIEPATQLQLLQRQRQPQSRGGITAQPALSLL